MTMVSLRLEILLLSLLPCTVVGLQEENIFPGLSAATDDFKGLPSSGSSSYAAVPLSPATPSSAPSTTNETCSCGSGTNASIHQLEKATKMKEQIKNKTSIISKIHHRATHSEDALWASVTLSALLVLLFVAVLHSRMWLDRSFITYTESQPIRYEQFNKNSEIKTRQMLKSRARSLVAFFNKRQRGGKTEAGISMETFVHTEDTVDSAHKALLDSSSSSSASCSSSDSSGEEEIFSINKYTGEWEGSSQTKQLLRKRRGARHSSTGSEELMNSSLTRELERVSSSSEHRRHGEEQEEVLIQIG